jgi:hypothetical protein
LIIFTTFTEQNFKEQTYKERELIHSKITAVHFKVLSFGEDLGEAKRNARAKLILD